MGAFLYNLGYVLNLSALYMTGAIGASFAIKAGDFNLGGEGQIYLGGFLCGIFLTFCKNLNLNPFFAIIFAFIISFCASAFVALISESLKKYKNASFLLTSFILSTAIIQLIDGLISGRFRGSNGNLMATSFIDKTYRFSKILKQTPTNWYFLFSIIICVGTAFLFYRTTFGKKLKIYGLSPEFATYGGFSKNQISFTAAAISGGMHGICGAAAVCGVYFTCHQGFYSGMGWNALAVAMLAKENPLFIIPSSLFMATLITTADRYALFNNFDFDISGLLQGIIIFLVSIPLLKNWSRKK
ncbi:MAG: hypothetical protein MJ188_06085 [Treponema sp.]|nr:hypothetical protein [Treponema sp.]